MNIDVLELVDICDVEVNENLSKEERIVEFVRQIKNPYCYKCGEFIVESRFSKSGLTLDDCVYGIMKNNF